MQGNLTKQKTFPLNKNFCKNGNLPNEWFYLCKQLLRVRPCWRPVSCHWHILSLHLRRNLKNVTFQNSGGFPKFVGQILTDRKRTLFNFEFCFLEITVCWFVSFSTIPIVCCWSCWTKPNVIFVIDIEATYLLQANCLIDWWTAVPHVGQALWIME